MVYLFKGCSSLKVLNIPNFKSIESTDMEEMFEGCLSLKEINCSNEIRNKFNNQ